MNLQQAFYKKWFGSLNVHFHGNPSHRLELIWYPNNYVLVRVPRFGVIEISLNNSTLGGVARNRGDRNLVGSLVDSLRIDITELGVGKVTSGWFSFDDIVSLRTEGHSVGICAPYDRASEPIWVLYPEPREYTHAYADFTPVEENLIQPRAFLQPVEGFISTWIGEYGEFHPRGSA